MSSYVRTVTTNTSQDDTLTSAREIAASLEADGLFVTVGDPYTDHTEHGDPEEQRHRVDLTVSTKAPSVSEVTPPVVEAPAPEPPPAPTEPEPIPDPVAEVEPDEVSA